MADLTRKTENLFDVNGQRTSTYAGISIVDDTIYISRIYSGAASYLIYAYTYSAGTYTISLDYTMDLTKVRFLSTISFEGGTYNSYYNAYYKDFDSSKTMTVIFDSDFRIGFAFDGTNGGTGIVSDIMMNTGNQPKPYEPYGWLHSLRKLTTATEAVENPLYSDGTAITAYTISGNTVQNGTPTPSNPVEVQGVGERTGNLWDGAIGLDNTQILQSDGTTITSPNYALSDYIPVSASTSYVYSFRHNQYEPNRTSFTVSFYKSDKQLVQRIALQNINDEGIITIPFTTPADTKYVRINWEKPYDDMLMLNLGETALPYESYGYKIPISSPVVTTNIYLGSTQTVRQIKKVVFDGTENWKGTDDTASKYLRNYIYDYKLESGITCMSTHYSGTNNIVSGDIIPNNSACFYNDKDTRILYLKGSGPITLANFKAYLAHQYTNGTPVTVWYVLATPETAAVNEPLQKIGTYADTLSNATAIPTTEGADSITVDTTVQPSEFTATWTGWHNASVKEKSRNLFDKDNNIVNYYLASTNGAYQATSGMSRSIKLKISPSSVYSITLTSYTKRIGFFENEPTDNDVPVAFYNNDTNEYSQSSFTITSPASANYMVIFCYNSSKEYTDGKTINEVMSSVMVNTGSTALPYEPYWK